MSHRLIQVIKYMLICCGGYARAGFPLARALLFYFRKCDEKRKGWHKSRVDSKSQCHSIWCIYALQYTHKSTHKHERAANGNCIVLVYAAQYNIRVGDCQSKWGQCMCVCIYVHSKPYSLLRGRQVRLRRVVANVPQYNVLCRVEWLANGYFPRCI